MPATYVISQPSDALRAALEVLPRDAKVIVAEINDEGIYGFGQLAMMLRAAYANPAIVSVTKCDGLTFKVSEIVAGIAKAYSPESLINRKVVIVANLAPRKMKFGMSEGMVLAAGPGGSDIFLLTPDDGAQPGMAVK